MGALLEWGGRFFFACFAAILHIFFATILPFPWNTINIFALAVILLILKNGRGSIVWFVFFGSWILELFSTTPFGVHIFSLTISALAAVWASNILLSRASWYGAIGLSIGFLLCFRALFILSFAAADLLSNPPGISWRIFALAAGWEILLTTAAVGICIGIRSSRRRQMRLSL